MRVNIKDLSSKYHQYGIRSEIDISLEIILIVFNVFNINFSTKVFTSVTAAFSFISVGIPCEFAMVPDVYILL